MGFLVVMDSANTVAFFDSSLTEKHPDNYMKDSNSKNGFEGLICSGPRPWQSATEQAEDHMCYSVIEAQKGAMNAYSLEGIKLTLTTEIKTDVKFVKENSGFEGVAYFEQENVKYLIGLCEGNKCESKTEKSAGEGRIILMRFSDKNHLVTINKIKIPEYVDFQDYSGIDLKPVPGEENMYRIGITSQMNSAVYISTIFLDPANDEYEFTEVGNIYYFPVSEKSNIK